jgi:hypothetical protein
MAKMKVSEISVGLMGKKVVFDPKETGVKPLYGTITHIEINLMSVNVRVCMKSGSVKVYHTMLYEEYAGKDNLQYLEVLK